MEDLRFTIDRSQLRGLRTLTASAAAAFVVLAGAWALDGRSGIVGMVALVAGVTAIIEARAWAACAAAFTECTPAGLRTRGLFGAHESAWPRIADIVVRPYGRTVMVMVTTASGARSGWARRWTAAS